MAEFETGGADINDLIKQLERADLFTPETQEALIDTAAEDLIKTVREEAGRCPYKIQSLLPKVVKSRKMKKDRQGNLYKTVSVAGKDRHGVRNATKFFVLNYGRSEKFGQIVGSYFWTLAVRRSAKTALRMQEKAVTEILNQKGLT